MRHPTVWMIPATLLLCACATGRQSAIQRQPTATARSDDCFSSANVVGWRPVDARTLIVRATRDRLYRLELMGICPEILSPGAHLTTTYYGDYRICSALDWHLAVSGPGLPRQNCPVVAMTRLSAAQVAALPKEERP